MHVIGIGTPLMLDDGEYIVYHISSKRETDGLGNTNVIPLVAARKHNHKGSSSSIIFTGKELEEALI